MDLRERLGATPQFQELDADELDALSAAMELIDAEDGHLIFREGSRGDGCYLIVDGGVSVQTGHGGDAQVLRRLEPGELFGLVSLLDDGPRSGTCVTAGPTRLAWLPGAAFTMLHAGNPSLVLHFQKMVARQLAHDARALNARLAGAMQSGRQDGASPGGSLSGELHLTSGD